MVIKKEGMAWLGKVVSIYLIEGADRIQRTEVFCGEGGRWTGVTTKDVQVNAGVVVFLLDAIVPQIKPLIFMKKYQWRVKPCRLRGCLSEVLIMQKEYFHLDTNRVGTDVTELLRVKKYEKDIPI